MSEKISDTSQATKFENTHVHAPANYDSYLQEMTSQWKQQAEEALQTGNPMLPMWLRRNGDSYTEFAAHIDYVIPVADGFRYLAALDISSDGDHPRLQIWMPKADGSGEPIVAQEEAYNLDSLQRALDYVELQVQSPRV